jgi:hypothetical protein
VGVEYAQYVIPRPNSFRPTAEQLASFVQQLKEHCWVPTRGTGRFCVPGPTAEPRQLPLPNTLDVAWFRERLRQDFVLDWDIEELRKSGLRYPLDRLPELGEEAYYELQVHVASDYVYHTSELIHPFDNESCVCGTSLEYDTGILSGSVFFTPRLHDSCPSCGSSFDPSRLPAVVQDGWTAGERIVPGGACYRFALVVDCGKSIPSNGIISLHPELLALCETHFHTRFYQVGGIH